jgi:importin subunit alpha-1
MALQRLSLLLTHEKKPIKREACWCLSNITAGSGEQIQCIVRDKQMLDRLIHLINTEGTEV